MHQSKLCLVVLVIIIIFYRDLKGQISKKQVKSKLDGNNYRVIKKYNNHNDASDMIAEMNLFTKKLIKSLRHVYLEHPDVRTSDYEIGKTFTITLMERYYPESLSENEPESPQKTSFTKNKGEEISLCLREKTSGQNKMHDADLLKFVLIHELAHVISIRLNHGKEFWVNFKFLLEFCERHDLYKSQDYKKNNTVYCGMYIRYNPAYDVNSASFFS